MDTFLYAILVIFAITFISAYLKSTAKDGTIKKFSKFSIIVQTNDGKTVWGKMKLFSNGMELTYPKEVTVPQATRKGYYIYKTEYDKIVCIMRILKNMSYDDLRLREKRNIFYKNGFFVRIRRWVRNFFAASSDAIKETLTLVMGKVGGTMSAKGQANATRLGNDLIGFVGNSYEPIYEKLAGKKVLVDYLQKDGSIKKYKGILGKYTKEYIEILNIDFPMEIKYEIKTRTSNISGYPVSVIRKDKKMTLVNESEQNLKFSVDGKEYSLTSKMTLDVKCPDSDSFDFIVGTLENVDVILPRTLAIVRHLSD